MHLKYEGTNDKNYCKIRDCCYHTRIYRGAVQRIFNLRYKVLMCTTSIVV